MNALVNHPLPALYLGCHKVSGHYLWREGMLSFSPRSSLDYLKRLDRFDGLLPPQDDRTPYRATLSQLPGWGYTALAFWDNSIDKRVGSNSTFFLPSLRLTARGAYMAACTLFPEVFARLPEAVQLVQDFELTPQPTRPPTSVPPMIPGDDL